MEVEFTQHTRRHHSFNTRTSGTGNFLCAMITSRVKKSSVGKLDSLLFWKLSVTSMRVCTCYDLTHILIHCMFKQWCIVNHYVATTTLNYIWDSENHQKHLFNPLKTQKTWERSKKCQCLITFEPVLLSTCCNESSKPDFLSFSEESHLVDCFSVCEDNRKDIIRDLFFNEKHKGLYYNK